MDAQDLAAYRAGRMLPRIHLRPDVRVDARAAEGMAAAEDMRAAEESKANAALQLLREHVRRRHARPARPGALAARGHG